MTWPARGGRRLVSAGLTSLLLLAGCAIAPVNRAFFGVREPTAPGVPGAPAREGVLAEGALRADPFRRTLTLRLVNQGRAPLPLGAAIDEYALKLTDGRVIPIQPDFLAYPAIIAPGAEQYVFFHVPYRIDPAAITQIIAKLDTGRVLIVLGALPSSAPALLPARAQSPQEPLWRAFNEPAPPVDASARVVAAPVPPAPASESRDASLLASTHVPVTVEFEQMLGQTQRVSIRWDNQGEPVTLCAGERRMFQVAPGPHHLQFDTCLAPIRKTEGELPLDAQLGTPVRVLLEATVHPTGTEMRARAWRGDQLIADQRAVPQ